jgi:hypothetical protein
LAPYLFAGLPALSFLGALLTAVNAPRWLRRLAGSMILGQAGLILADEMGDYSTGANDNASGVALLFALAERLVAQPLRHTEVVLAFTGCETVGASGAAELAACYGDAWADAWWIITDSVGAGELCWVTEHGWSAEPGTRYHPHPEVHALLTRVAAANPALGIMGRPLITLDAVGPLIARKLKAGAVMGYERSSAFPVNWRRADDCPEWIDPEVLGRAARFLQAVLTTIDEDAGHD